MPGKKGWQLWHHFRGWLVVVADHTLVFHASMQPEQPLIAPTLMGRGGDTALGMEQRSPEQRPPPAASPRAAVQVVLELIAVRGCKLTRPSNSRSALSAGHKHRRCR